MAQSKQTQTEKEKTNKGTQKSVEAQKKTQKAKPTAQKTVRKNSEGKNGTAVKNAKTQPATRAKASSKANPEKAETKRPSINKNVSAKPVKTAQKSKAKVESTSTKGKGSKDSQPVTKPFGKALLQYSFMLVLLTGVLYIVGALLFPSPVSPQYAQATIMGEEEISAGQQTNYRMSFFGKNVQFEEDKVHWYVDGVEVKQGDCQDKNSFLVEWSFDGEGQHVVEARFDKHKNLNNEILVKVTRPVIEIDVSNSTMTYGDKAPTITYRAKGFMWQDSEKGLVGKFDLTTAANEKSDVGFFDVTCNDKLERYDIKVVGQVEVLPRQISLKPLHLSKTYDGNNMFSVSTLETDGSFDGVEVGCSGAKTVDCNVGTAKKVAVEGIALRGKNAKNFTLKSEEILAVADITARKVSLVGAVVSDKCFDGTNVATLSKIGRLEGVLAGDDVTVAKMSVEFEDSAPDQGKKVAIKQFVLGGKSSQNYEIALQQDLTATIHNAEFQHVKKFRQH